MSVFFADRDNMKDGKINIVNEDAHHIATSLRARVGEFININVDKVRYNCIIEEIFKDKIICKIISKSEEQAEPDVKVRLMQALVKGDKAEHIIQKSVELGVDEIVFFKSKNCVVDFDDKTVKKKLIRYNAVAKSAAMQCGRDIIPKVLIYKSYIDLFDLEDADKNILFYENEKINKLRDVENKKSVNFIVGPEGGFDKSEVDIAKSNGYEICTLGNRILRTETVSTAVLACIMFITDNL